MIISLCIVVMNRTDDLKQTLPKTIEAAKASPGVEIVILDYDSKDDLVEYLKTVDYPITYKKSPNHKFFSISHSRNCAVKASSGDYIVIQDADIILKKHTIPTWRAMIAKYDPVWLIEEGRYLTETLPGGGKLVGGRLLVCQRNEFMKMGGYDERFNLCGPEDKDICMRLYRRGGRVETFSRFLIDEIKTRQHRKIANLDFEKYRAMVPADEPHKLQWTKLLMQREMRKIYIENCQKGVLVANEGKEWGQL
jgi:glycosyltransferase involved in cell wall biosynthesis